MRSSMRQLLWISGAAALFSYADAQSFTGDMTTYTLGTPMSGNCNFMMAPAAASQNYAALNGAQWDSTKNCGRCAEVSCIDSRCKDTTKTEIVYILDQCPECKSGDLDISPTVTRRLTGADPGRYKIKWKFVDCPVTGNLKYCLKTGSNAYYAAIQPANAAAGVKSMTINSKATTMVPSAYYYLLESNINLSSVKVSVTSLSGETVTDTVSLTAGQCTTGTSQFKGSGSVPSAPVDTPTDTPTAPTDAPVSPSTPTTRPTTPTTRPTPTTRRPRQPTTRAPTPASPPDGTTPKPPRTETTQTPAPSTPTAVDSDGDKDVDAPTSAPATSAPATSAPSTPAANTTTATPSTPATTTAPASTTSAPVAPSTPAPSKNKCRRRED